MTNHIWKREGFQVVGNITLLQIWQVTAKKEKKKKQKQNKNKQDGEQFDRLVWTKVDISMGLAVKVHIKTRKMENKLILCGVIELKKDFVA